MGKRFENNPFVVYKGNKNLQEIIGSHTIKNGKVFKVHSKSREGKCEPCNTSKPSLCCKQVIDTSTFQSYQTQQLYTIFHKLNLFGQNRAEYRNWGNDITGLETNRIYCHINGLKTKLILITNIEHVLMVKPLIYEILLSFHKRHYIFQAFKRFSGSFNKHG